MTAGAGRGTGWVVLVAEFGAAAGDVVVQFGADRVVQGRRFVPGQRFGADVAGPGGGVL